MPDTTGAVSAFRAGVKAKFPLIDQDVAQTTPNFPGNVSAFLSANGEDGVLAQQLKNVVKKCPGCGKANA